MIMFAKYQVWLLYCGVAFHKTPQSRHQSSLSTFTHVHNDSLSGRACVRAAKSSPGAASASSALPSSVTSIHWLIFPLAEVSRIQLRYAEP